MMKTTTSFVKYLKKRSWNISHKKTKHIGSATREKRKCNRL